MDNQIHIITVYNDLNIFNQMIGENPIMNRFNLTAYDNTTDNIGISTRYNSFLNTDQPKGWLIFCHQDFAFLEDISDKLANLNKDCIYGPIGVVGEKQFIFELKIRGFKIKKAKLGFVKFKTRLVGQIEQGKGDGTFVLDGQFLTKPHEAETVDCCCLIVHSELINKHLLRFDENLNWHLYSEDFSLNARTNFGIKTKAVQLKSKHLSLGKIDDSFKLATEYLHRKYPGKDIASTCYNGFKYR